MRVKGKFALMIILSALLFSAENFALRFSFNVLRPRDADFRQVYGGWVPYYEVKASWDFYGDYYLWGSYGLLWAKGQTLPYLHREAEIFQHYLGAGVGFTEEVLGHMGYKIELGFAAVIYKEKALGTENSGKGMGFRGEAGLVYNISRRLFTELTFGYIAGYEKMEDFTLKMGGFKTGVTLGINF